MNVQNMLFSAAALGMLVVGGCANAPEIKPAPPRPSVPTVAQILADVDKVIAGEPAEYCRPTMTFGVPNVTCNFSLKGSEMLILPEPMRTWQRVVGFEHPAFDYRNLMVNVEATCIGWSDAILHKPTHSVFCQIIHPKL